MLLVPTLCAADVVYSTAASTYSQDFDTLSSTDSATPVTWTNDVTITGWFSTRTTYLADDGDQVTPSLYSYGVAAATDRALGSVGSASTTPLRYGVRLTNTTGLTLRNVTITFDGEQWRDGDLLDQTTTFDYKVGEAPGLTDGSGYMPATSLNFTSPISVNSDAALDGNLAANRVAGITATFDLASNWLNGQELFLRWTDVESAGGDHGLAIDNFSFVARAVPEISPFVFGIAICGLAGLWSLRQGRRRTEAKI